MGANAYLASCIGKKECDKTKLASAGDVGVNLFATTMSNLNILGDDIYLPPDVFKGLLSFAISGDFSEGATLFGGTKLPSFQAVGKTFVRGQITSFVDKQLGLPPGTTGAIYEIYKIQIKGTATPSAGYAAIITLAFGKQLNKMDEKLGIGQGTLSMAMPGIVAAAMGNSFVAAMGGPIGVAFLVGFALFGVSKVVIEYQCPYPTNTLGPAPPLGGAAWGGAWVDAKNNQALWKKWAQNRVLTVIDDALRVSERMKRKDLMPSQIATLREDDVLYFSGRTLESGGDRITELWGSPDERGNFGIAWTDSSYDHVHISW